MPPVDSRQPLRTIDRNAPPSSLIVEELLRVCAMMLRGYAGGFGGELALELQARAAIFERFRHDAEKDRRRGLILPAQWIATFDNKLPGGLT